MNSIFHVAIVEDDVLLQEAIKTLLGNTSKEVFACATHLLEQPGPKREPHLIFLDLCHPADPDGSGTIALIPTIKNRFPKAEVIIQSGIQDIAMMKACIAAGAQRFVLKDHLNEEIPFLIEAEKEILLTLAQFDKSLIGQSELMKTLKRQIAEVRSGKIRNVLIQGDTGSGKELVARALGHSQEEFVAVNAAAIPKELFEAELFGAERGSYTGATQARVGLFERAQKGVVFLDEIQSLDLELQPKLLRVLETRRFCRVGSNQERPFEGRVIAAANLSLSEMVNQGRFREDLYFRLSESTLKIPPLRLRAEDIPELIEHFQSQNSGFKRRFDDDAIRFLKSEYDWPGNIRELRNFVRTMSSHRIPIVDRDACVAFFRSQDQEFPIDTSAVAKVSQSLSNPVSFAGSAPLSEGFDSLVEAFEKQLLVDAIQKHSSSQAREILKLPRTRFYEKLKRYGLSPRRSEHQLESSPSE